MKASILIMAALAAASLGAADTIKLPEPTADSGVTVTVRRRLGSDIDASCGQLRRKYTRI